VRRRRVAYYSRSQAAHPTPEQQEQVIRLFDFASAAEAVSDPTSHQADIEDVLRSYLPVIFPKDGPGKDFFETSEEVKVAKAAKRAALDAFWRLASSAFAREAFAQWRQALPPLPRQGVARVTPVTIAPLPGDFALRCAAVQAAMEELNGVLDREDAEFYTAAAARTTEALLSGDPVRLHAAVRRVKNRKKPRAVHLPMMERKDGTIAVGVIDTGHVWLDHFADVLTADKTSMNRVAIADELAKLERGAFNPAALDRRCLFPPATSCSSTSGSR